MRTPALRESTIPSTPEREDCYRNTEKQEAGENKDVSHRNRIEFTALPGDRHLDRKEAAQSGQDRQVEPPEIPAENDAAGGVKEKIPADQDNQSNEDAGRQRHIAKPLNASR